MPQREMLQKKICMVGAFAVGKTSLVRRFVESIFDERYHTTIGVKIDKCTVQSNGQEVMLVIWDLAGEDFTSGVNKSYLRGAAGYLLVADGTRASTIEAAKKMRDQFIGDIPFVYLLNKCDLEQEWEADDGELERMRRDGWHAFRASAKTGHGVSEAFQSLAKLIV